MAVFFHDNRSITYQTETAPVAFDVLFLQSSRLTMDFWRPVMDDLKKAPEGEGRLVLCNWFHPGTDESKLAGDLEGLIKTLSLNSLHVVAEGDSAGVLKELEKAFPERVERRLLYAQPVAQADDLTRAIRGFLQI